MALTHRIRERSLTCSDPRYSNYLILESFSPLWKVAHIYQQDTLATVANKIAWWEQETGIVLTPAEVERIERTYKGVPEGCY